MTLHSALETARRLAISRQRLHQYLQAGRITGAQRIGRSWVFAASARILPLPKK